jgi:hypothetical protein
VDVDVWYTGYHSIGHISVGTACTLLRCRAGYCMNQSGTGAAGSGDVNPYVSYAGNGGQELLMVDCEVTGGGLPSYDWAAQAGQRHGSAGVFQHTNDGSTFPVLSVAVGTLYPDNPFQVARATAVYAAPAASVNSPEQCRAYIVDERPAAPNMFQDFGGGDRDRAYVNCDYSFTPTAGQSYLWGMLNTDAAFWAVNNVWRVDVSGLALGGNGFVLWNKLGSGLCNARLDNLHFHLTGVSSAKASYVTFFATFDSVSLGTGLLLRNGVFTMDGATGTGNIGAVFDSEPPRVTHNAYWLPRGPQPGFGYFTGDPGAVVLTSIPTVLAVPGRTSTLYGAGTANGLEYDYRRAPRSSSRVDIGPVSGG